jgi:hypothetical protein
MLSQEAKRLQSMAFWVVTLKEPDISVEHITFSFRAEE